MKAFNILLCAWLAGLFMATCSKDESSQATNLVESRLQHLANMTKILQDNANDCSALLRSLRNYHDKNKDDFGSQGDLQTNMSEADKKKVQKRMKEIFLPATKKLVPVLMQVQKKCEKEMTEIGQIFQAQNT